MKSIVTAVIALVLVVASVHARFGIGNEQPVADALNEAQSHVRTATEEIRAAEDLLAKGFAEPSIAQSLKNKLNGYVFGSQDKAQDSSKDSFQQLYEKAKSATRTITPASYDEFMHRLKVAVGVESPTVWERIRSAFGIDRFENLADQIKYNFGAEGPTEEGLWERVKHAFGEEDEGLLARIQKRLGYQPSSTMPSSSELLHKLKVALGTEDRTIWEKIQNVFTSHSGVEEMKLTGQQYYEKIKEALKGLDPTHHDTVMEKVKKVFRLQEPSWYEKLRDTYSTGAQETAETIGTVAKEAIDKADEVIRGKTYDTIVHKLKSAVGLEDPTLWEKVESALTPRESYGDKIKHAFGRDTGITRGKLMERLHEVLSSLNPAERESYTTKFKKALGLEEPSLLERIKQSLGAGYETVKERADTTAEYLTGKSYDELLEKIKGAVGTNDVWESIKSGLQPHDSLTDNLKHVFVKPKGITMDSLMERVQESLSKIDPTHRDTYLTKIKKAVGMEPETMFDRLRDKLGTHDAAEMSQVAVAKANELLKGDTFDDAVHRIKMAFGAEDPTLRERISNALAPRDTFVDKVKHVFGRDSGITRGKLMERLRDVFGMYDPRQQESYLSKVKRAIGLEEEQQPSFFTRTKESIGHLFTGGDPAEKARSELDNALAAGKKTIDSLLDKLKTSTSENREKVLEELKRAIHDASQTAQEKSASLYELFGGKSEHSQAVGMTEKISKLYSVMQHTVDSWLGQIKEFAKYPSTHGQYLLQSSKHENGISTFYVNDNGREMVDATGENLSEKGFNKLECLNSFRRELNLEPYSSIPDTATVQVHAVKRPHVFVKSMRMMDKNRFEYVYDDGHEALTVEWNEATKDKNLSDEETQHLIRMFRQDHGLSTRTNVRETPTVRSVIHRNKEGKA